MNDSQKEQLQIWQLKEFNFSDGDISRLICKGWSPGKILDKVNELLDAGLTTYNYAAELSAKHIRNCLMIQQVRMRILKTQKLRKPGGQRKHLSLENRKNISCGIRTFQSESSPC